MPAITRSELIQYAEESLSAADAARVEKALRGSPSLRRELQDLLQTSQTDEHTLGAIWRRHRISCPSRDELARCGGSAEAGATSPYLRFHLETVACPYCLADLHDLGERTASPDAAAARRESLFQSSRRQLHGAR